MFIQSSYLVFVNIHLSLFCHAQYFPTMNSMTTVYPYFVNSIVFFFFIIALYLFTTYMHRLVFILSRAYIRCMHKLEVSTAQTRLGGGRAGGGAGGTRPVKLVKLSANITRSKVLFEFSRPWGTPMPYFFYLKMSALLVSLCFEPSQPIRVTLGLLYQGRRRLS